MPWVRVDDKFKHHPKVLRAGVEAVGFWLIACCWVAEYATDGHVPAHVLPTLFGYRPDLVDRLLDSGMWVKCEDGYTVHDFLRYNPSRAQQEAKRDAWREKQARRRTQSKATDCNDRNSVPLGHGGDSRESPGMGKGDVVVKSDVSYPHITNRAADVSFLTEPPTPDLASTRATPAPRKRTAKVDRPAVPAWLPAESWAAWERFRKAGKAPWTPDAAALSLRNLEALRAQGQDPVAIIEQSIQRGWTGLFPVRADRDSKPDNRQPERPRGTQNRPTWKAPQ